MRKLFGDACIMPEKVCKSNYKKLFKNFYEWKMIFLFRGNKSGFMVGWLGQEKNMGIYFCSVFLSNA